MKTDEQIREEWNIFVKKYIAKERQHYIDIGKSIQKYKFSWPNWIGGFIVGAILGMFTAICLNCT